MLVAVRRRLEFGNWVPHSPCQRGFRILRDCGQQGPVVWSPPSLAERTHTTAIRLLVLTRCQLIKIQMLGWEYVAPSLNDRCPVADRQAEGDRLPAPTA